jgi:hypothetical protein
MLLYAFWSNGWPEVVACFTCRLALPQPGDIGARARPGEGGKVGCFLGCIPAAFLCTMGAA